MTSYSPGLEDSSWSNWDEFPTVSMLTLMPVSFSNCSSSPRLDVNPAR